MRDEDGEEKGEPPQVWVLNLVTCQARSEPPRGMSVIPVPVSPIKAGRTDQTGSIKNAGIQSRNRAEILITQLQQNLAVHMGLLSQVCLSLWQRGKEMQLNIASIPLMFPKYCQSRCHSPGISWGW